MYLFVPPEPEYIETVICADAVPAVGPVVDVLKPSALVASITAEVHVPRRRPSAAKERVAAEVGVVVADLHRPDR